MDGYHQPVLVRAQTRPEGTFLEHSSQIPANIRKLRSYEVTSCNFSPDIPKLSRGISTED